MTRSRLFVVLVSLYLFGPFLLRAETDNVGTPKSETDAARIIKAVNENAAEPIESLTLLSDFFGLLKDILDKKAEQEQFSAIEAFCTAEQLLELYSKFEGIYRANYKQIASSDRQTIVYRFTLAGNCVRKINAAREQGEPPNSGAELFMLLKTNHVAQWIAEKAALAKEKRVQEERRRAAEIAELKKANITPFIHELQRRIEEVPRTYEEEISILETYSSAVTKAKLDKDMAIQERDYILAPKTLDYFWSYSQIVLSDYQQDYRANPSSRKYDLGRIVAVIKILDDERKSNDSSLLDHKVSTARPARRATEKETLVLSQFLEEFTDKITSKKYLDIVKNLLHWDYEAQHVAQVSRKMGKRRDFYLALIPTLKSQDNWFILENGDAVLLCPKNHITKLEAKFLRLVWNDELKKYRLRSGSGSVPYNELGNVEIR